jgi:HlyD family secretion protein
LRRAWIWVVALVIILVLLLVLRKHEPPQVAFTKVKRGTIVSNLPTNGKVEPLEWESVRAEATGLIASVPVKEGQKVAAGAIIARLSQPGAAQELAGASARAAQYRNALETLHRGGQSEQLAELDAGIAKARFDREVADRDYHTLQRLVEKQAATNFEVVSAKQRLDAAELAIKTLALRRQALVSPNDVAAGRARLAEAEADQQSAEVKLDTSVVRSRISGTVYSLPARPGNYVNAGDLLANIGNLDQLRVKVFVDEPELGRIKVGLPVRITWDGLPTRVWEGVVERMPTEIVALGTRQVGEVWATIVNQQRDLVPGTTVNAEVRTDVAQNALVIPKAALRRDRGPVGVYVLRGGRLVWQPVSTATSDVTNTSITKGLKEGELVLLPTDTPVKEGDRVRALVQ